MIRLVTTEPDFAALNDDAHTVAIPVAGSFEDYIKVFLANDRTLDTMYAGAWFSDSAQWGIWGVRMLSTMVVGFRREPPKPFAELARECGLRPQTMDEILDLTRLDFGIGYSKPPKPEWVDKYEQYCAEFRRNYSR